jgi:CRISPR/Cas system-associated protein endoribonuclease Cas2
MENSPTINIDELCWLNGLRNGTTTANDLSGEQKSIIAQLVIDRKLSKTEVIDTYNISRTSINKWIKFLKSGRIVLERGRPERIIPELFATEMVAFVDQKYDKKTNEEYEEKANELAVESNVRRGLTALPKPVDKKTMRRYEQKNNIEEATAEKTTKARYMAVSCARNAVSFAAMNFSLCRIIEPGLIFNADATQFKVGYSDQKTKKVKVLVELDEFDAAFPTQRDSSVNDDPQKRTSTGIEIPSNESSSIEKSPIEISPTTEIAVNESTVMEISPTTEIPQNESTVMEISPTTEISPSITPKAKRRRRSNKRKQMKDDQHGPLKIVVPKIDEGLTAYFIKYYLLINAVGMAAHPVFVIADPGMPEDEIDVYESADLHTTPDCKHAYIIFCHSRQCNIKFYEWFNNNVLIPMVCEVSVFFEYTNLDSWFQLDGETTQLECFNNLQMLQNLLSHRVTVGKPPGGTTAATQPRDRGNCFRNAKCYNRELNDQKVIGNVNAIQRLGNIFQMHYESCSTSKIRPTDHQMAILGLLRIQMSLQRSTTVYSIKRSFQKVGIYPYDLNQILRNFKVIWGKDELENINKKLPEMSNIMLQKGEITEAEFDALDIRKGNKVVKEEYVFSNRRSLILTNQLLSGEHMQE